MYQYNIKIHLSINNHSDILKRDEQNDNTEKRHKKSLTFEHFKRLLNVSGLTIYAIQKQIHMYTSVF